MTQLYLNEQNIEEKLKKKEIKETGNKSFILIMFEILKILLWSLIEKSMKFVSSQLWIRKLLSDITETKRENPSKCRLKI